MADGLKFVLDRTPAADQRSPKCRPVPVCGISLFDIHRICIWYVHVPNRVPHSTAQ